MHTTSNSGPLPYSSKNQFYLSPYYENKWGNIRISYSWRDDYESESFNGASAIWTSPYARLNATATVNISKNLTLTLGLTNLLDETYQQYFLNKGAASVLADAYKEGRGGTAEIHWNF
jgi:iron complex outermembrane receptor protein